MVLIKKRRNVWSSEEVLFFLKLVNEKHILGLMDGKRLRVSDIFKTLVAPMEQAGFRRDVAQLTIKWKNLKAEYYKCKRHNGVSGNDPAEYEFYEFLDEILGHRSSSQQQGFDSSQPQEVTLEELYTIQQEDPRITFEMYDDIPDEDGAIPGGSTTPGIQIAATPTSSSSSASSTSTAHASGHQPSNKKTQKPIEILAKINMEMRSLLEAARERELEADRVFLDTFLKRPEEMMKACTGQILKGLKNIFRCESDDD